MEKDNHLMEENITKIIKIAKWGKSQQKIFKKGILDSGRLAPS